MNEPLVLRHSIQLEKLTKRIEALEQEMKEMRLHTHRSSNYAEDTGYPQYQSGLEAHKK